MRAWHNAVEHIRIHGLPVVPIKGHGPWIVSLVAPLQKMTPAGLHLVESLFDANVEAGFALVLSADTHYYFAPYSKRGENKILNPEEMTKRYEVEVVRGDYALFRRYLRSAHSVRNQWHLETAFAPYLQNYQDWELCFLHADDIFAKLSTEDTDGRP